MNIRLLLPLLCLLCSAAGSARADGKMYWRENVPPSIPYQRAVIFFQDGVETLVLQSKYQMPGPGKAAPIGWVVPVPAVPELASVSADHATDIFNNLARSTAPQVTKFAMIFLDGLLLLAALLGLLFVRMVFSRAQGRELVRQRTFLYGSLSATFLLLLVVVPQLPRSRGDSGVEVLRSVRIGIYTAEVIKAKAPGDLNAWLQHNGFSHGEADTAALTDYISRGWCFVAARIDPPADARPGDIASEGLAAPLILQFPHEVPVYPLQLTGSGGFDTEVLIYLLSDRKWTAPERMTLRYYDVHPDARLVGTLEFLSAPPQILNLDADKLCHRHKFKDLLTPARMSSDLLFAPAPDGEPYREHRYEW